MKITFLGTGTSQGIPVIACNCDTCKSESAFDKRLRSSLLLEADGVTLVVDAGPDFRQQMLRQNVSSLDAILITHEHKDHIGGMDDVRAFNFIERKAIDIYCDRRVKKAVKREYSYVFAHKRYPGSPMMNIKTVNRKPFYVSGIKIIPVRAFHKDLPVFGFRFGCFTYLTDVSSVPNSSLKLIKGTRYLVVNALRKEKHPTHFNLDEALGLIKLIKPEKAYLTHIGHKMGLHKEVSEELPANVELAYDGLSLDVDC